MPAVVISAMQHHVRSSLQRIGIERVPEPLAPAVDWLRIRSVEAALVSIYAARPRVWIGQVAEGVVPRFELRVYT